MSANPFGYLTTLISVVLGLGIAHLLAGLARSISRRATISFYWPTVVWVAVVLITIVQAWWFDFSLSKHTQWTLPGFASMLLVPATLYFMAFLILPETADMRTAYFQNRVWFFGLLLALPFCGALQQLLVEGHVRLDADTAAKAVGALLTVAALSFPSENAQEGFALAGIAFIVCYALGLFFHLPAAV